MVLIARPGAHGVNCQTWSCWQYLELVVLADLELVVIAHRRLSSVPVPQSMVSAKVIQDHLAGGVVGDHLDACRQC
ncbi:hypothetical protein ACOMHN_063220 [Nucella lapillus]